MFAENFLKTNTRFTPFEPSRRCETDAGGCGNSNRKIYSFRIAKRYIFSRICNLNKRRKKVN